MRISLLPIAACLASVACYHSAAATTPPLIALDPVTLTGHDTIPVGELRGRVRATSAQYAIAASSVSVDSGRVELRTDSAGYFVVDGLLPGIHRIEVRRMSLRPMAGSIAMPPHGGAAIEVLMEPVTVCLDYCAPEQPRAYGEIRNVP